MLPPILVTLALGLWGMRRQNSMWGDEAVTYEVAHRSASQIWHTIQHVDLVHGVYYLFMHVLFAGWEGGLLTLRLPSVVAMSLAAGGIALLGQRLAGPRAGLLAGLAFPLIPLVQQYAQEGRSYAIVCALVTWSSYLLLQAADRSTRRWWAGYAVLLWVAAMFHEFAVLVVPAHGIALLLSGRPRALIRAWATAAGCAVAGLLPLIVLSRRQAGQVAWIGWPDALQLLGLTAMALAGLWCARHQIRARELSRLSALALPVLLLPGLLLLAAAVVRPLFVDRYVLYCAIGFALLLGAELDRRWGSRPSPRWTAWVALAAVLVPLVPVSVYLRTPQSRHDNATAVGHAVRQAAHPGDGLLFVPARHRVWTSAHPQDTQGLTDLALAQDPASSDTLSGVELPAQDIPTRMRAFSRIVVVHDPADERPDHDARELAKSSTLRDYFQVCGRTIDVTGAHITDYCLNR
ncbi:glycosyltransferase family 39 protein [Kitasatospora sp. MAP5-34]|uniref:glycosyltransferase family 39 protein n=1 Tax=Kitasatospora sp. MAP5-34 TaxID=3035102 RepID=UPI0024756D4C|nr:glycosyltransferase family 39 protein [Kitasatospora sp. MAP5-34]